MVEACFARQLERELRECEAGAAVLRECVQQFHDEHESYGRKYTLSGFQSLWFNRAKAAMSTNAGRELLAEVERLRFGCNQVAQVAFERDEALNKRAEANTRISCDAIRIQLMEEELASLRRKVAAAEGLHKFTKSYSLICISRFDLEVKAALTAWQEANT